VFGALYAAEGTPPGTLADVAREFSPRIDIRSDRDVALDLNGVERLFGSARTIAEELRRTAADRGLRVRIAIAGTRTAARLLVRHRAGMTVVEPGNEAAALASLSVSLLTELSVDPNDPNEQNDLMLTFRRWGVRTLGELAALPADDLAARLGQHGVVWQRLARGEDPQPLVPSLPEERFSQSLDLEWPIEEIEPLSFVLGRLMEPLSLHLERRDRGAAVLHVRLHLVKMDDNTPAVYERSLQLPAPMRDARTLRTLALLDLESNPPPAPIDRVEVAVDPTPGRIVQYSLLTRAMPTPERLSTLMARLHALMGETRCGAPALVDSWRPEAFEMRAFAPVDENTIHGRPSAKPVLALRRFRHPIPVRVQTENARPRYVAIDRRGMTGGGIESCAGPWRTAGDWWREGWDRDEWDVTVRGGTTYRLFRARDTDRWFVEGVVD